MLKRQMSTERIATKRTQKVAGTLETGLFTATMLHLYMYRNLWPMIALLLAWTLLAPQI
jgi:hypothetical protein